MHPGFNTSLSYGWRTPGTDAEITTTSGRKHLNIHGVIAMDTLDVLTRTAETINADSVCVIVRALRRKHPREKNSTHFRQRSLPQIQEGGEIGGGTEHTPCFFTAVFSES